MKIIHSKKLRLFLFLLFLGILTAVTFFAARWVMTLRDPAVLAVFQEQIQSLGMAGWLVLLTIQYVQIVVAVIPGGPIQMVAGALLGPIGGLAICLVGSLLATATVFALVKRYGHRIIRLFVKEKDLSQYKFLQNSKRLEVLTLILFLIPGTPKDVLTYLFALTPIKTSRFMLISSVARVPAVLTSVLAGDSIVNGQWLHALIYFCIITVISLGGLALHRKVMDAHKQRKKGRDTGSPQ